VGAAKRARRGGEGRGTLSSKSSSRLRENEKINHQGKYER
jgi:hypothetical protein